MFFFSFFCNAIYSCDAKTEYLKLQLFLQSSVSHDPSEIILICLFSVQESDYYEC